MNEGTESTEVVLLRNGHVFDGSGGDGRSADVLVVGGRIAEVGPKLGGPKIAHTQVVDLDGLVLAPDSSTPIPTSMRKCFGTVISLHRRHTESPP